MQDDRPVLGHTPRPSVKPRSKFEGIGLIQDILCINCQELISLSRISDHSFKCTQVTMEVKAMESQNNELEAVKFRVRKLSEHLRRAMNSHLLSPSDKSALGVAKKLTEKLLGDDPLSNVKFVGESLDTVMEGFRGALSVLINLERLKALTNELKEACLSQELQAADQEIQSLKAALDVEVQKASSIRIAPTVLHLDDIHSSVHSSSVHSSAPSTSRGAESTFEVLEEAQMDTAGYEPDCPEEAKRRFYAQCLEVKLALRSRSKGLKVSIPLLFDKATQDCIPPSDWKEFIRDSMENPDPALIQRSKTNPKFTANQLDTRFTYFGAPITESESATELD